MSIPLRFDRRPDESDRREDTMARHLFLIRGGDEVERAAEREIVRRRHLELVRTARERHIFADPRVQLADDLLAQRFGAA
jgi:hypothetical protein